MPTKFIDAEWKKGAAAVSERLPGHSVIVRDASDPSKDRRIPCASRAEADALHLALQTFKRDGVTVMGAVDPPPPT